MFVQHPSQYADHVQQLAAAFGVQLVEESQRPPDAAFAGTLVAQGPLADLLTAIGVPTQAKVVVIAPVFDETTYAVALHELGHCIAPNGVRPEKKKLTPHDELFWLMSLGEEEAAWDWAQHHALEWTGAMQGVREWATSTYAEGRKQAMAAAAEVERAKRDEEARVAAWHRRHRVEPVEAFLKSVGGRIR